MNFYLALDVKKLHKTLLPYSSILILTSIS